MPAPKTANAKKPSVAPSDGSDTRRVIKKYPNRRLYDTTTSTYITLTEIKDLVMKREPFVVRDAKTSDDLTRSILMQIILEEEAGGAPMLTEEVLSSIIRFHGHAMQSFMGSFIEKNILAFTEMQAKVAEKSSGVTPEMWNQFMNVQSPVLQGMMGTYNEQSKNMLAQMQEQMLGAFGFKR